MVYLQTKIDLLGSKTIYLGRYIHSALWLVFETVLQMTKYFDQIFTFFLQ